MSRATSIRHVEHRHRRAARADGALQSVCIGLGAAELEDRVAVGNAVLHRRAVVEPDMRQPRAGPGGRLIVAKQMLRPARHVADDRRIDIAVAELGADHLVALALLDVGDGAEILPRRRRPPACRSRMSGRHMPRHLRRPMRRIARRADIALADLAALDLVGREQIRATPAGKRRRKLPRQIDGVADAGIHAEPAGRDDEMHRVAGEEDAALAITIGEQKILPPRRAGQHLVFDRNADGPLRTPLFISSSVSTSECRVQCLVESCMIRNVALSSAT